MARNETLTTTLAVKDQASKIVDEYAEQLEGLDNETIVTTLALKAAGVQGELADVLADLSQVDKADPEIDLKVKHAAELKAELDAIATKLTEIGKADPTVNVDGALKRTKSSVDDLGKSADNSRSVLANMVGNSAQDLGALSGVAGSAGVALGQMAEYAADGNISLAGLAKTAGPLLALSVATALISDHLQDIAKTKAWNKEQVDKYVEAVREGVSVLEAAKKQIEETAKIEFVDDGDVKDATDAIDDLGMKVEDFWNLVDDPKALQSFKARAADLEAQLVKTNQAVANGTGDWQKNREEQARLREELGDVQFVIKAVENQVENLSTAEAKAAQILRVHGEEVENSTTALEEREAMLQKSIDAQEAETAAAEEAAQAHRDTADALREEVDARRAAADATFALHDAQQDLRDTLADVDDKLKAAEGDWGKIRAVYDDVAQGAGDVADAQVRVFDETAKANGQALTAKQRLEVWNSAMLTQAATLNGPARDAILNYIAEVNGIPPEKLTDVKAALDEGSVERANLALNAVSESRSSLLVADAETTQAEKDINETARPRTVVLDADASAVRQKFNAALAGFTSATGRSVTQSSAPQTVIVNLPRGARHGDIARAMQAHTRRVGRRFGNAQVYYARR